MKRVFTICSIFLVILFFIENQGVITSGGVYKKRGFRNHGSAIIKKSTEVKDNTDGELSDTVDAEEKVVISEFILGVGDEIEVTVYRHSDLNKKVRVLPDGVNSFPLIGEIRTEGLSIHQLREKIKEAYSTYLVSPQISIEVTLFKGQKIFILGEVRNPGVYRIDPPMTIYEAISMAGGFTMDGKDTSVLLIRGGLENPEVNAYNLDFDNARKKGKLSRNVVLQRGDVVYVPRTFIANVDRFFKHFENIVRPLVYLEQGVVLADRIEEIFSGKEGAPIIVQPIITQP
ncbi:MAG: polysaccharide export protein [wastewater metagenome]|nr:polysaccharide export protein [Candidatus Loosdrechtia aerotolerans]